MSLAKNLTYTLKRLEYTKLPRKKDFEREYLGKEIQEVNSRQESESTIKNQYKILVSLLLEAHGGTGKVTKASMKQFLLEQKFSS